MATKAVTKTKNVSFKAKCWRLEPWNGESGFIIPWITEADHFYLWSHELPSGAVVRVAISTEEDCESFLITWSGPLLDNDFEAVRKWAPWEEINVQSKCAYDTWRTVRKYSRQ